MSEPREIEPTLGCEPTDLATLQQHPLLQKASEQGVAGLSSTDFDTAEQRLREAGLGVRVRPIADRHVQTLKAEGDGLFSRPEWEQTVNGSEPDLAVLGDTPLDAILGRKDGLHPCSPPRSVADLPGRAGQVTHRGCARLRPDHRAGCGRQSSPHLRAEAGLCRRRVRAVAGDRCPGAVAPRRAQQGSAGLQPVRRQHA
jgi:CYTH domain